MRRRWTDDMTRAVLARLDKDKERARQRAAEEAERLEQQLAAAEAGADVVAVEMMQRKAEA